MSEPVKTIYRAVQDELYSDRQVSDWALGYLRYEALRKLNPRQFTELYDRNLKGENFDGLVDELILKP